MFQFRRFPAYAYLIQRTLTGSSPAGLPHSEIHGSIAYLRLTVAYRSLSRPSSAPDAKASSLRPSSLDLASSRKSSSRKPQSSALSHHQRRRLHASFAGFAPPLRPRPASLGSRPVLEYDKTSQRYIVNYKVAVQELCKLHLQKFLVS